MGEPGELLYLSRIAEYDLPGDDHQQQRDLFYELEADSNFIAPCHKHAQLHAQFAPAYMYAFLYRSAGYPMPQWMGVPHFEEVGIF